MWKHLALRFNELGILSSNKLITVGWNVKFGIVEYG